MSGRRQVPFRRQRVCISPDEDLKIYKYNSASVARTWMILWPTSTDPATDQRPIRGTWRPRYIFLHLLLYRNNLIRYPQFGYFYGLWVTSYVSAIWGFPAKPGSMRMWSPSFSEESYAGPGSCCRTGQDVQVRLAAAGGKSPGSFGNRSRSASQLLEEKGDHLLFGRIMLLSSSESDCIGLRKQRRGVRIHKRLALSCVRPRARIPWKRPRATRAAAVPSSPTLQTSHCCATPFSAQSQNPSMITGSSSALPFFFLLLAELI